MGMKKKERWICWGVVKEEQGQEIMTSKIYIIWKGEHSEKYRHDQPYMYRGHLEDKIKWKLARVSTKEKKLKRPDDGLLW